MTIFWFWLCGRFPVLGVFTSAFLVGFIGGLFGSRGGGCYYGGLSPAALSLPPRKISAPALVKLRGDVGFTRGENPGPFV